ELGLEDDSGLRAALHVDEERIATLLLSIFQSHTAQNSVLRLEGDSAQSFLDVVQNLLDKGFLIAQEHGQMARRIIGKLSAACDKLPSSLFIAGVNGREEYPIFVGGYGEIYRATYSAQTVALKYIRAVHYLRGTELRRLRLNFAREALVWKDLHHPHILPFLGIDLGNFPARLGLVSPW
ncbi:hypothetical protein B0H16DRAFT_1846712, partial [Mycena metata]